MVLNLIRGLIFEQNKCNHNGSSTHICPFLHTALLNSRSGRLKMTNPTLRRSLLEWLIVKEHSATTPILDTLCRELSWSHHRRPVKAPGQNLDSLLKCPPLCKFNERSCSKLKNEEISKPSTLISYRKK